MMQDGTQAEFYSQYSVLSQVKIAELLAEAIDVQEGQVVLDLGCGTGEVTVALGKKVGQSGRVHGIDPDSERIDVARQKHKSVRNVSFALGTSADAVATGPYDVVFSSSVLHWVKNKEPDFRNVFKSLKSGGIFGFTSLDRLSQIQEDVLVLQCDPSVTDPGSTIGLHFETMDVWLSLCKSAGFSVVGKKQYTQMKQFPSLIDFLKWYYGSTQGRFSPWKN
eukprot:m.92191 g.92191  ORF g.92191 m.92191 type:complete len:221 (+) comp36717_c0_seq5:699-1361(+)